MKATTKLHGSDRACGWNITREMPDPGQLQRYTEEFSVTGLTSNPTIFEKAVSSGARGWIC